ncbi:MAG: diguanylate cyclase, partial [Methylococcales bacterium]|nr:diguanylate cyclase [Methylococcales bacterium]
SIPILQEDRVLGVMALYLHLEHKLQGYELDFLNNVAKVLAVGISRRLAEEESSRLVSHNSLTNLPNRLLLEEKMQTLLSLSVERILSSAVIYIAIDRFDRINDFFGYAAGDSVLIEIAQRFSSAVRKEGMLAHLGGIEFAILVNSPKNQENSIFEKNQSIIKKLKYFLDDLMIKAQKLNLTFSAGIVIIDGQEKSPEDLLSQARMALCHAKIEGQNSVGYFAPEMQQRAQSKLTIENNLRFAMENGEMELYFQPQFNENKKVFAAEALLRWNAKNGLILPGEFLPVAEESGLIVQLGDWVIEESCRKIVQWNDKLNLQHIAVNVSTLQFNLSTFIETVDEIL